MGLRHPLACVGIHHSISDMQVTVETQTLRPLRPGLTAPTSSEGISVGACGDVALCETLRYCMYEQRWFGDVVSCHGCRGLTASVWAPSLDGDLVIRTASQTCSVEAWSLASLRRFAGRGLSFALPHRLARRETWSLAPLRRFAGQKLSFAPSRRLAWQGLGRSPRFVDLLDGDLVIRSVS